jgi:hypothetical protein
LGTDRIEVFVDATREVEHGGPEARWSRWLCHDLRETNGYLERVGCREIPLEGADSSQTADRELGSLEADREGAELQAGRLAGWWRELLRTHWSLS